MKDFRITGPYNLEVFEKEIPNPGPYEVLIKISTISICGSDTHLFHGTYNGPRNYPINFGHEWSGIVERTGENVHSIKAGDKVTGDCSCFCGSCSQCREDRNLCESIEKYGITINGASSEYILRPERHLYKLPPKMVLPHGAIVEPLAVGAHLLERTGFDIPWFKDKKVLVTGAGGIGMGIIFLLKHLYKVKHISVCDLNNFRLDRAVSLGAEVFKESLSSAKNGVDKYENLYSGKGFDLIVETTGSPEVFSNTLDLLNPRGTLACIGMIPEVKINQKLIVLKALKIVGSIGGTGNFDEVIESLNTYPDDAEKIISHQFESSEENIKKAFQIIKENRENLKVQLQFS